MKDRKVYVLQDIIIFDRGSPDIAQADLELTVLLPQPPKC